MAKNMMKKNANGAMKATTIRGEKHVHVDTPAKQKVSVVSDDKALNAKAIVKTHYGDQNIMIIVM